jgi:hypothetical protein
LGLLHCLYYLWAWWIFIEVSASMSVNNKEKNIIKTEVTMKIFNLNEAKNYNKNMRKRFLP